jgi:hypothetical protein
LNQIKSFFYFHLGGGPGGGPGGNFGNGDPLDDSGLFGPGGGNGGGPGGPGGGRQWHWDVLCMCYVYDGRQMDQGKSSYTLNLMKLSYLSNYSLNQLKSIHDTCTQLTTS